MGLPSGAQDIPRVIQDRTFDAGNQLVYATGSPLDGSMEYLMGFLGERVLVNGQSDFVLQAETRAYRLRLLNGSNARTYKLAWDDGTPLTVIATDGGLLERPVERPYVMLAPGERIEHQQQLHRLLPKNIHRFTSLAKRLSCIKCMQ